ncbi:MAG TPA: PP2C family serine/threonine-protein phosphatase [Candidatus Margulisiibacteriota bacterium]|nr:PP2C family serine/threonine-protein phosphatase [Candidatus Margulisiibacteriota bacterium]
MPTVDFAQLTDIGCVREGNEDAIGYWPHEDGLLFAVADGLGGHNAGEVASALALEILAREMDRAPGTWSIDKRLRRAIQEANIAIHQKSITVPELRRMGTTITASAVVGRELVTAHVGDCRLYRVRNGQLTQLTKDHTWVSEQVEYGILSAEEARTHPRRHMLTRSLGQHLIVGIDLLRTDAQNGDLLVQCSDGIHSLLPEAEIAQIIQGYPPQAACEALVQRARDRGGDDNMSIQIAAVIDAPPPATRSSSWWRFGR